MNEEGRVKRRSGHGSSTEGRRRAEPRGEQVSLICDVDKSAGVLRGYASLAAGPAFAWPDVESGDRWKGESEAVPPPRSSMGKTQRAFESSNLSPPRKTGLSGRRSERGAKPFSKSLFNYHGIWDAYQRVPGLELDCFLGIIFKFKNEKKRIPKIGRDEFFLAAIYR
jgi:hypothetical protein